MVIALKKLATKSGVVILLLVPKGYLKGLNRRLNASTKLK
jgi:hypothetical protein